VMVHAVDATFQNREIPFDRVCVSIAPDIFADRVNNRLMAGEFFADLPIDAALICAEVRLLGQRVYK
jgi:hypothetical protein